jgi:hypothetical protein
VCVFAYSGSTRSRMASSMKASERPEAVESAYTSRRGPNGPSSTASPPITAARMRSISGSAGGRRGMRGAGRSAACDAA